GRLDDGARRCRRARPWMSLPVNGRRLRRPWPLQRGARGYRAHGAKLVQLLARVNRGDVFFFAATASRRLGRLGRARGFGRAHSHQRVLPGALRSLLGKERLELGHRVDGAVGRAVARDLVGDRDATLVKGPLQLTQGLEADHCPAALSNQPLIWQMFALARRRVDPELVSAVRTLDGSAATRSEERRVGKW